MTPLRFIAYLAPAAVLVGLILMVAFGPRARAAESPGRYALTRCDLGKPCTWTALFGHSQDCLDEIERVTPRLPSGTVLQCSVVKPLATRSHSLATAPITTGN